MSETTEAYSARKNKKNEETKEIETQIEETQPEIPVIQSEIAMSGFPAGTDARTPTVNYDEMLAFNKGVMSSKAKELLEAIKPVYGREKPSNDTAVFERFGTIQIGIMPGSFPTGQLDSKKKAIYESSYMIPGTFMLKQATPQEIVTVRLGFVDLLRLRHEIDVLIEKRKAYIQYSAEIEKNINDAKNAAFDLI
ncbi:hypothetical protein [Methanolapillus millepedarum]|uniref:Uncharacterized protein n=1 Tax=Methanolapillus millepedarum TaxID=3028296 RepID=A0AA96V286_9EURY|nr:hypothetical protein MsAc7_07060 [Methanosarcinaceae archaeon Ac7]